MTKRTAERGNALVYVFVGVALFGILIFIFSRGANQNTASMTTQQANIAASDVLQYRQSIESAVQRLIAKGCSEADISFDNELETGYNNTSSPTDKSCHVFDPAGGKAKYIYPSSVTDTSYAAGASPGFKKYGFNGNMAIEDLGTTEPELIMWLMTNKQICDAINKSLGKETKDDLFGDGLIGVPYVGNFSPPGAAGIIGDQAYEAGSTGCFNRPTYPGQYIFYSTLLAR